MDPAGLDSRRLAILGVGRESTKTPPFLVPKGLGGFTPLPAPRHLEGHGRQGAHPPAPCKPPQGPGLWSRPVRLPAFMTPVHHHTGEALRIIGRSKQAY